MTMTQSHHHHEPLAPYLHFTLDELDHRARRAEHMMNRALEQHRWHVVRSHRHEMLSVDAEIQRRLSALVAAESYPEEAGQSL